ncbi:MAG: hypothetical protein R2909_13275 [Gemmatimonadales bacterium]
MSGALTKTETASEVPEVVAAFLTQLGIALHKSRAYPPGHPMRDDSVRRVAAALSDALQGASSLRVGVGRKQLMVDGASTPTDHYVLRDFASRLNRRHLGAMVFHANAVESDFVRVIAELTRDESEAPPADEGGAIELIPVSFNALSLDTRGRAGLADAVDGLWRELASRALTGPGIPNGTAEGRTQSQGAESTLLRGPDELARALIERLGQPETRSAVAGTLESIARNTSQLAGRERAQLEVRLRHLLAALPPESLSALLELDLADPGQLDRLVPAMDWLPVSAALDLVEAASKAQKEDISTSLLRMIKKLAGNVTATPDEPTGEHDLRAVLKGLLESWTLSSPNPWHHTRVLDFLSARDVSNSRAEASASEGLRLVQMAIETETFGDQVVEAVELAVDADDVAPLVRALEATPPDHAVAPRIWAVLASSGVLRRVLVECRLEASVVASILARVPDEGFQMLFDLVLIVDNRDIRRLLLERIARMGASGAALLTEALGGLSDQLLRRVLGHLAELPNLPQGVDVRCHLGSTDPLIRIAVYKLVLREPEWVEEAIQSGLTDADERVVRLAVDAGLRGFPRTCLPRLMLLLNSPTRSPELKARAVPILSQLDTPSVRQWLTDRMLVRRGWFRRLRLAPKSPIVLEKLRVLAGRWGEHPDAQRILKRALASGDEDLRAAAGGREAA